MLKRIANGWQPGSMAAGFRQRRLDLLCGLLKSKNPPVRILDIGGQDEFWKALNTAEMPECEITFLNIFPMQTNLSNAACVLGDARCMPEFKDGQFDLAFSNSVIEHVGGLREQRRMAEECQRVAASYFVQTPNRYFPLEPHFLFPGFQFLPQALRAFLHSRFDLGWWRRTGDFQEALEEVESIRLLSRGELRRLFANGTIWEEKFLGLTKSFVVHGQGREAKR